MRTKQEYKEQLKRIADDPGTKSKFGIKRPCALNKLQYWHLTNNRSGDLMHDFLEGVGPYELKLILYHLSEISHYFTLEELNSRIAHFPYGPTDTKNRPSAIPNLKMDESNSLKQKAMQFYCLFRLLPHFIGDLVAPGDKYWEFFLELREVADILFSQSWSVGMMAQFKTVWSRHQQKFKKLFPGHKLLPKHHFLCHYGTFAKCTGPPYKSMVAPQEMKGNFFKRSAHIVCNFKNICYTLAWRHQFFTSNMFLSRNLFNNAVEVYNGSQVTVNTLGLSEKLQKLLSVSSAEKICTASRLKIDGQLYREGMCIVLDENNLTPTFGRFYFAVSKNFQSEPVYFVYAICNTLCFEEHLFSFRIERTQNFDVVLFGDLKDYHPLDMYSSFTTGEFLISMRYCV